MHAAPLAAEAEAVTALDPGGIVNPLKDRRVAPLIEEISHRVGDQREVQAEAGSKRLPVDERDRCLLEAPAKLVIQRRPWCPPPGEGSQLAQRPLTAARQTGEGLANIIERIIGKPRMKLTEDRFELMIRQRVIVHPKAPEIVVVDDAAVEAKAGEVQPVAGGEVVGHWCQADESSRDRIGRHAAYAKRDPPGWPRSERPVALAPNSSRNFIRALCN